MKMKIFHAYFHMYMFQPNRYRSTTTNFSSIFGYLDCAKLPFINDRTHKNNLTYHCFNFQVKVEFKTFTITYSFSLYEQKKGRFNFLKHFLGVH